MKTSLKPGMTLQGRYKILAQIGKGGMGYVYKVYGLRLNKEYALKEMYDHFVDPEDKERVARQFQNEAETMAKLDHPGIPRILDTFEESERHYLVMEFVDGRTLEQVVLENPQYILESQMLEWMEQILDIMDYLHNRPDPVVIRDLKPANVMLTGDGRIKIIDFGIAKIFDPKDRTQTAIKGSGSAGFAPPEQYGSGGTDPRSDIYALGVTLYYLLSKVIIADSVDRILQGGKVNPPSHYNPLVSEAVDAMILKMVELKPDDRFQSVAEIMSHMEDHNLRQARPAQTSGTLPASTLPRTAVRLGNQDVVEDWKKRQSQVNLAQPAPVAPAPVPLTSSAPPARDRDYHFVTGDILKGRGDDREKPKEKKKEGGIPSFIYTGLFVAIFLFMMALFAVPFVFRQEHKPASSPKPSVAETTPTPEKAAEKSVEINGTISRVEKTDEEVKIRIKGADGPLTLVMKRADYPKKARVGAVVKAEYRVVNDGSAKPPWPVISMSVTRAAPAPKPAYTPPPYYPPQAGGGGYSGGGRTGGGGYSGGGGGGGRSGGGSGGSSGGSGGGSSSGGSGSLTHQRPTY